MFSLLMWLVYGLVVGLLAKALHPGDDPVGFLPTVGIGVAGSFVGGFINWVLGYGGGPFQSSGLLMGVIGALVFLAAWRWWRLKRVDKSFWSGKDV
jgi:uncharacterized membrane protein YeaQ/YmgE (transglycosylase-associated protein family)